MAMEKVAQCQRCGAPIFLPAQAEWVGGVPPKVSYTCECTDVALEVQRSMSQARLMPQFPPAP